MAYELEQIPFNDMGKGSLFVFSSACSIECLEQCKESSKQKTKLKMKQIVLFFLKVLLKTDIVSQGPKLVTGLCTWAKRNQ